MGQTRLLRSWQLKVNVKGRGRGRPLYTVHLGSENSRFLRCAVPFGFAQGPAPVGMTNFLVDHGLSFPAGAEQGPRFAVVFVAVAVFL